MASSDYKLHKTELIALYRLEFYRKQKSWKFAYDGKKTPRSKYTKTRKALNETYEVKAGPKNEQSSLNKGFLEDAQDKDVEQSKPPPAPATTLEDAGHTRPWSEHCSEPERDDQRWWDTEQEICQEPVWEDPPVLEYDGWVGETAEVPQAWATGPAVQNPLSTNQQIEELAAAIERCATLADISGQCLDQPDGGVDLHHDASSESLAEFMRGAHLAPHSSEIDLRDDTLLCGGPAPVPRGVSAASVSSVSGVSRVSRLSGSALSARVRLHASALATLLRETALRRQNYLSRTCSELLTPSWRGAPSPPAYGELPHESCSVGRGRGRLHRHMVGVDMGRPYRL